MAQVKQISTGYTPHAFQAQVHREMRRFSVLVCHRRWGKTVLAVNALIDGALRVMQRAPRLAYVAPQFNQAKSVAWDYLKFYTRALNPKVNESESWVELPNGARIRVFGADNPDSLRGLYLDGVVLDEVAQMKPEVWGEVIRPALADRKGWALFIGTPKGINLFFELHQQAMATTGWYAATFRADETGLIDQEELEAAKAVMSDSQFRQEFLCDFTASNDDTLISLDLARGARGKHLRIDQYEASPRVMGVDVARFGDDQTVICIRQGLVCFKLHKWRGLDAVQVAEQVARLHWEHKVDAIFIDDTGGYGAGVVDYLRRQLRLTCSGINFGGAAAREADFVNKRAEMWALMRDWLKDGGAMPDDQELVRDVCAPTYTFDNRGRLQLEKKQDIKKRGLPSPDCGDALALTFAAPVAAKRFREAMPQGIGIGVAEYNPFEAAYA